MHTLKAIDNRGDVARWAVALPGTIMSEEALITLYVSLTGSSEALARSVVIYVETREDTRRDSLRFAGACRVELEEYVHQ